MAAPQMKSGFVSVDGAQIYYEVAGEGTPFVMIHAGVADSRQWNNEFAFFSQRYQVVRYDLRGYGKSEPVPGEFSHMNDLASVLKTLELHEPVILMGCSMGGGLAMDFAVTRVDLSWMFRPSPNLPKQRRLMRRVILIYWLNWKPRSGLTAGIEHQSRWIKPCGNLPTK
jgi:pimeloyl-ACP methyl ester carboxylesterase